MDETTGKIISPFLQILWVILKQSDEHKKSNDIITFVNKFTRISDGIESVHWLYCIKTGVALLPIFKLALANAFIQQNYTQILEQIKNTIGEKGADGDRWTDKHTGWDICRGELDSDEGYDEAGNAIKSRDLMPGENKVTSLIGEIKVKYITHETNLINNIVNALSIAMGINLEHQKEFIINSVVKTIQTKVENENDYMDRVKESSKKNKKMSSYIDFFNQALLYYTFGMYLIATQTSIPSIKSKKTHPGCVFF